MMMNIYLKESKEKIQLLSRSSTVETDTAGVEHRTNKAYSEEVVWQIQRIDFIGRRSTCS